MSLDLTTTCLILGCKRPVKERYIDLSSSFQTTLEMMEYHVMIDTLRASVATEPSKGAAIKALFGNRFSSVIREEILFNPSENIFFANFSFHHRLDFRSVSRHLIFLIPNSNNSKLSFFYNDDSVHLDTCAVLVKSIDFSVSSNNKVDSFTLGVFDENDFLTHAALHYPNIYFVLRGLCRGSKFLRTDTNGLFLSHLMYLFSFAKTASSVEGLAFKPDVRAFAFDAIVSLFTREAGLQFLSAGNSEILEIITNHVRTYPDKNLSLLDMEQITGYSRRAIQYEFAKRLRCSPMDWQRQERLSMAKDELSSNPGRKIIDVAYDFGFDSPNTFSSAFKKQFGISPIQLKRERRRP